MPSYTTIQIVNEKELQKVRRQKVNLYLALEDADGIVRAKAKQEAREKNQKKNPTTKDKILEKKLYEKRDTANNKSLAEEIDKKSKTREEKFSRVQRARDAKEQIVQKKQSKKDLHSTMDEIQGKYFKRERLTNAAAAGLRWALEQRKARIDYREEMAKYERRRKIGIKDQKILLEYSNSLLINEIRAFRRDFGARVSNQNVNWSVLEKKLNEGDKLTSTAIEAAIDKLLDKEDQLSEALTRKLQSMGVNLGIPLRETAANSLRTQNLSEATNKLTSSIATTSKGAYATAVSALSQAKDSTSAILAQGKDLFNKKKKDDARRDRENRRFEQAENRRLRNSVESSGGGSGGGVTDTIMGMAATAFGGKMLGKYGAKLAAKGGFLGKLGGGLTSLGGALGGGATVASGASSAIASTAAKVPTTGLLKGASGLGKGILGRVPIVGGILSGGIEYATSGSANRAIGSGLGSTGGALAGAAAGAALGSIIPGIGTAIGGIVGGILGSMGGDAIGTEIGGMLDSPGGTPTTPPQSTTSGLTPDAEAIYKQLVQNQKEIEENKKTYQTINTMDKAREMASRRSTENITLNNANVNLPPNFAEEFSEQAADALKKDERSFWDRLFGRNKPAETSPSGSKVTNVTEKSGSRITDYADGTQKVETLMYDEMGNEVVTDTTFQSKPKALPDFGPIQTSEKFQSSSSTQAITEAVKPPGAKSSTTPGPTPQGLGSLSAKYESGSKGSNAIGYDKVGGASYGKYQIATKTGTMNNFMNFLKKNNPEAYNELAPLQSSSGDTSGAFANKWKELASNGKLGSSEHDFIKETHYDAAYKKLDPAAQKAVDANPALQEVLWSTSVQHGAEGAKGIFNKSYSEDTEQMITNVYNNRRTKFGSSTEAVRQSVMNRFDEESKNALAMHKSGAPSNLAKAPGSKEAAGLYQGEAPTNIKIDKDSEFSGLNDSVKANLRAMADEYKQTTGKDIKLNEGFRTREEQEALYNDPRYKAAKPGTSKHEFGYALDIKPEQAVELEKAGLLDKYGFHRPFANDPKEQQHIEPKGITREAMKDKSFNMQLAQGAEKYMKATETPALPPGSTQVADAGTTLSDASAPPKLEPTKASQDIAQVSKDVDRMNELKFKMTKKEATPEEKAEFLNMLQNKTLIPTELPVAQKAPEVSQPASQSASQGTYSGKDIDRMNELKFKMVKKEATPEEKTEFLNLIQKKNQSAQEAPADSSPIVSTKDITPSSQEIAQANAKFEALSPETPSESGQFKFSSEKSTAEAASPSEMYSASDIRKTQSAMANAKAEATTLSGEAKEIASPALAEQAAFQARAPRAVPQQTASSGPYKDVRDQFKSEALSAQQTIANNGMLPMPPINMPPINIQTPQTAPKFGEASSGGTKIGDAGIELLRSMIGE